MNKKTVKDIDLKDKKVLVRCDFNVPMDENKNITDNRRIVAALPTIKYLLEQNCKIILCSHLGRPTGEFKPEFSLAPVAKELSKQLNMEVVMAKDVIGEDACKKAEKLNNGEILLLENLRFHREETDNDPEFAKVREAADAQSDSSPIEEWLKEKGMCLYECCETQELFDIVCNKIDEICNNNKTQKKDKGDIER